MENLLPLFIALTGISVAVQAGVLLAMYVTMRRSSARVNDAVNEIKTLVAPALESAMVTINDARPKLTAILENIEQSTVMLRAQVTRVDAASNDALDRGRLQLLRADEMATRILDRIENTSDLVHKSVIYPVRQVSGVIAGITAGLEYLLSGKGGRQKPSDRQTVPQDEMFI